MTPFSNVYERFSTKTKDYMLDEMFSNSVNDYEDYLYTFLSSAIAKFEMDCVQDLERDTEEKLFSLDLSDLEEEILASLMVIEWMTKEINSVKEMRLALQTVDWKRYSESNNLKAKSDELDKMSERVENLITRYQYKNYEWI